MSLPKNADADKTNFRRAGGSESVHCCCALLTAAGRSAIAVIGVRGQETAQLLSACFMPASEAPMLPGQVRYGRWSGPTNERPAAAATTSTAESVVVVPLGTADFEIQCHGGVAASGRIINDLRHLGANVVESTQWFGDARTPLLVREAQRVLTGCLTAPMAAIAMDQIRGAMLDWSRRAISTLQATQRDWLPTVRSQAETVLRSADVGLRLTRRYQVVLLGPPNVGKSSLVNAIVGYDRSITMNLAGTTRDVLHAETVIEGVPIRLSDTAGLRESGEPIERQGVTRAQDAAQEANLIVLVSDPDTPAAAAPLNKPSIRVFNKFDLTTEGASQPDDSVIRTVATTGQGVDELIQAIATALVRFPEPGSPVPVTVRQVDLLSRLAEAADAEQASTLLETLIDG